MEESPSSLNDSFDDQEREVADILLDLPHLVRKDIVKRFGPYWGSKKTRSAISVPPSPTESVSPSAIAAPPCTKVKTVPDNFMTLKYDKPLSDQPLPTVPSTSYATTSIKIKDKSLCVQPLSTVPSSSYTNTTIKFNDGSPSPGATTSVCHREPKPLRKNTKKKSSLEELKVEVGTCWNTKRNLEEAIDKVKLHLNKLQEFNLELKARKQGGHLSLGVKIKESGATQKLISKEPQ